MVQKLLLDTDIGTDIDDAVCLAYLLAQPECELLGITTVTGEARKRAMLASALCKVARKDIPIYPGADSPLIVPQKQTQAQQAPALEKWPHETEFPSGEAIEFLRSTIRANPHEITLLSIGPLTNIALLFAVDPEIPSLLKQLVMMCGIFGDSMPDIGNLEWNAIGDPHATSIVYRARPSVHRSIGLNVTMQVHLDRDQVLDRFKSPLLQPVLDFSSHWFEHCSSIVFHDPLAAVTIFEPSVCQFQRGTVSVTLEGEKQIGETRWNSAPDGSEQDKEQYPHEVAMAVDPDRFFDDYFGTLNGI